MLKQFFIYTTITSIILSSMLLSKSKILAEEMSSENYKIESGGFNITSGTKKSESFSLQDIVGQTAAALFTSEGFIIQAGFLNQAYASAFSLTVNPVFIDFGDLSPNSPKEKTALITISNGEVPGYQVWIIEDKPLSTKTGAIIEDTKCNRIGNVCTPIQAVRWSDINSYGFGYRLDGRTIPLDFANPEFFRPFAAESNVQLPVNIMSSNLPNQVDQTKMILRVNISSDQPVGQYENAVIVTASAGI